MAIVRFFVGSGWLTTWYLLFYVTAVFPALLFLGFLRLARRDGGGASDGVALSYAIFSMLISIVTILNVVLGAAGVPVGGALKYPLALFAAVMVLSLYWAWTSHALGSGAHTRGSVVGIHAAVTLLLLLNLYSLWIFQNRPRPSASTAEIARAITPPLQRVL